MIDRLARNMKDWATALIVLIFIQILYVSYAALKVINDPGAELGGLLAIIVGGIFIIWYLVLIFVLNRFLSLNRLSNLKLIVITLLSLVPFLLFYL